MEDLAELILLQLKSITNDVGQFTAGVLFNDISNEEQIAFATRLVDLAITIKERAEGTAGLVVEGSVISESDSQGELPPDTGPEDERGRWDPYPPQGGKVVWAELPVYPVTSSGMPRRRSGPSTSTPAGEQGRPPPDLELLRRIRDGLERL